MEQVDEVREIETFPCVLCLDQCAEEDRVKLTCGCCFCRSCLTGFFTVHVQERSWGRLKCPGKHETPIRRSDLKRLLPRPLFLTYVQHVRDRAVTQDNSRVLCPGADCAAVCRSPGRGRAVRCADCGLKFCCGCRSAWSGPQHKCAEEEETPEEGAKRCPRCGVSAFRAEGCAQVRCAHCGHSFCWLCLEPLENDPLHFINGACRSPRARMWSNRCGLGFGICALGFVGLLISPFLIICSPCACLCPWGQFSNVSEWFEDGQDDSQQDGIQRRFVVTRFRDNAQEEEMTDEEQDAEQV